MTHAHPEPTQKIAAIEKMLMELTGSSAQTQVMLNARYAEFEFKSMKQMIKLGKEDAVLKFIQARYSYSTALYSGSKRLLH